MRRSILLVSVLFGLVVLSLNYTREPVAALDQVCSASSLVDDEFNGTLLDRCK